MTATPEAQEGPSAAAAEKPPVVEMVDLYLTAEAVRIAIPIVAEAGIADLLLEGPRSVSNAAAKPPAEPGRSTCPFANSDSLRRGG